jgi:hypothetical protein
MEVSILRKEIANYLNEADERFLKLVYGMMQADKGEANEPYEGFDMVTRAEEALKDIAEGKVKSFDEFLMCCY